MRSGRISLSSEYQPRVATFPWLINRRIYYDMPTYFQSYGAYRAPIAFAWTNGKQQTRVVGGVPVVRPRGAFKSSLLAIITVPTRNPDLQEL